MAGPIKGSIEHFFNGTGQTSGSAQTAFVNVYNFLNNNTASLGLIRIAYHSGSTPSGAPNVRGMNYYNSPNPAGDNAWACFAFMSASNPFYLLVQWSGDNSFGTTPGSPALVQGGNQANSIGFAMAQRLDGGNPWNGSSGSNGRDTKGTPVWHPGTSSLVLYPRSNDSIRGGSHATSKQNTMGRTSFSGITFRQHIIADYDRFVHLIDTGNTNNWTVTIISTYVPISGNIPSIPYFAINGILPLTPGSTYGTTTGDSSTDNGGIAYPNVVVSGSVAMSIDRMGTTLFQTGQGQPNRGFDTPRFDEHPFFVGLFETPIVGLLGQDYDFFREVYNVPTQDTNGDSSRACFGSTTLASVKLTVPWISGTVPGSGVTREGVQY